MLERTFGDDVLCPDIPRMARGRGALHIKVLFAVGSGLGDTGIYISIAGQDTPVRGDFSC